MVSTWQGDEADESPTRTLALEIAARVSSSTTYTNRLPLILPSATPPPGIIFGSGGPLTPPHPTAAAANPMKERSFRMASSSTPRAEKKKNISERSVGREATAAYMAAVCPRPAKRQRG